MSKHILIVDLPDDAKCNCCHAMDEQPDGSMRCPILEREIVLSGIDWVRPSDCPLIPVDRVMKRITTTVEPNGYFNEATRRALDETIEALRDELGLEE